MDHFVIFSKQSFINRVCQSMDLIFLEMFCACVYSSKDNTKRQKKSKKNKEFINKLLVGGFIALGEKNC